MACALLQVSAWSAQGAHYTSKSSPYRSRLRRCRQRWCGLKVFGVRCSADCPKDDAGRSLHRAAGNAALAAGIRDSSCAMANRCGSRRLRMRWQRPLAVLRPRVALRSRQRACLSGPLGLLRALPRSLVALSNRAQQVHVSTPPGRLRSEMFQLHMLMCCLLDEDPRGGTGFVVVVPRGLRQQCRLGFMCLGWSPVIFSFQAVLLQLVQLTLHACTHAGTLSGTFTYVNYCTPQEEIESSSKGGAARHTSTTSTSGANSATPPQHIPGLMQRPAALSMCWLTQGGMVSSCACFCLIMRLSFAARAG